MCVLALIDNNSLDQFSQGIDGADNDHDDIEIANVNHNNQQATHHRGRALVAQVSQSTNYSPPSSQPSQSSLIVEATIIKGRKRAERASNSEYGNIMASLPPNNGGAAANVVYSTLLPTKNVEQGYSPLPVKMDDRNQIVPLGNPAQYNQIPPARIDGYTKVEPPGQRHHQYNIVSVDESRKEEIQVEIDLDSSSSDEKIIQRKRPMPLGAGRSQYESPMSHLTLSPLNVDITDEQ